MDAKQLEVMGQDLYPDVSQMHEERRELFRLAALSALRNGGAHLSAEDRARHEHWARLKPLGRALSSGVNV